METIKKKKGEPQATMINAHQPEKLAGRLVAAGHGGTGVARSRGGAEGRSCEAGQSHVFKSLLLVMVPIGRALLLGSTLEI